MKLQVFALEALSPDSAVGDGQGPWSGPLRDQQSSRGNARWVAHGIPEGKTNTRVVVAVNDGEAFSLRANLSNKDGPVEFETRQEPISVRIIGFENR